MSSKELFERAKKWIPGGVNSPVRAFKSVGGDPVFMKRGEGAWLIDVDDHRLLDYVCSWGPLILGHAHPGTGQALTRQLEDGWSYGAPTAIEVKLAELVCEKVPSIERVRMVNSGTEATMSAVRLARGFTGRSGIIKFSGCYHGHVDSLLTEAGSGVATLGIPSTPGVTEGATGDTLICPFNDIDSVRTACADKPDQIAAIIVEPVAGNMGVVPPKPGFLEGLRHLCDETGALLIFDEVMTGFRLSPGGAQALYGVTPDLTTLGKIIGGGLPVGAYGGRHAVMERVAPEGPVYQAGTLSGNPLAMTAGYLTLQALASPDVYDKLEASGTLIENGMKSLLESWPDRLTFNRVGSMFTLFFNEGPVTNFDDAKRSRTELYARFFHEMLSRGIYFAPSQFESGFISLAHGKTELEDTVAKVAESVAAVLNTGP
jgi:glutamate-1-semialdehyde 2,1-aminomutase